MTMLPVNERDKRWLELNGIDWKDAIAEGRRRAKSARSSSRLLDRVLCALLERGLRPRSLCHRHQCPDSEADLMGKASRRKRRRKSTRESTVRSVNHQVVKPHRPIDLIDWKQDLALWLESSIGESVWGQLFFTGVPLPPVPTGSDVKYLKGGDKDTASETGYLFSLEALRYATPYWVTEDMGARIEDQADEWNPDWPDDES